MVALAALTFALIENRPLGLTSAAVLGSLAPCAAAGSRFLIAERRSPGSDAAARAVLRPQLFMASRGVARPDQFDEMK